jgi:hypothetical protein
VIAAYAYSIRAGGRFDLKIRIHWLPAAAGFGGSVSILVLPDHGLLKYGGFHLNLAAGLEDDIVSQLKPRWKKTGK